MSRLREDENAGMSRLREDENAGMTRVRRGLVAVSTTVLLALGSAPAIAQADDPPSPDDTVMDVLDSVLAQNAPASPTPTAPAPVPGR